MQRKAGWWGDGTFGVKLFPLGLSDLTFTNVVENKGEAEFVSLGKLFLCYLFTEGVSQTF